MEDRREEESQSKKAGPIPHAGKLPSRAFVYKDPLSSACHFRRIEWKVIIATGLCAATLLFLFI
jgi:hypothetical protein